MNPAGNMPNAECTRELRMRFSPRGRWYALHPTDLDLERFLERHEGRATVRLSFLILRNIHSPDSIRGFHPVHDVSGVSR